MSYKPGQQVMGEKLGINIEETVFMNVNGEHETFVKDHVSMSKLCQMLCCPACCLFVPLTSAKNKIEYVKNCGLCACPYAVILNGQQVGKVHDVGCCDNGCMFCCCPCLTCSGKIKLMGMDGADGQEKFVFAKSLFPCWPCITAVALGCAPFGICCVSMQGCYNYACNSNSIRTVTQPVYKGPFDRNKELEKIGDFVSSQRFEPISCCCAYPTPLRYYFKPANAEGQQMSQEQLANLSLVLQLYRGMPVPCKLCSPLGFQAPTGVWCLDCGLDTTTEWKKVQDILRESAQM